MARGKKTSPEVIYKVMTSYAITRNYNQTARELNMAYATVKDIVQRHENEPEFVKLQAEKQDEFAEKATRIINKALIRLEKEIENEENDIPVNQLTTAIGTLYDKRALSRGEMTQNLGFATNLDINKLAEISGYAKKDDSE